MRSSLDCIPCFMRQAVDAVRAISNDPGVHEDVVREVLLLLGKADLSQSPPSLAQDIHRHLRMVMANDDPYRTAKDRENQMALHLLPELRAIVSEASHPLEVAVRLAIAGNVIDMGTAADVTESSLRQAINQALEEPLAGDHEEFYRALEGAASILYLADNAGEIVFDRLLVEQLGPQRMTVAVRGAPVLNDATLADVCAVGLDGIVEVIDNGSDAPGTILSDCSQEFRRRFAESDLVIAKGQGNFESLSDEPGNIFFLFKIKCQVIADQVGIPIDTHVLMRSQVPPGHVGGAL